MDPNGPRQAEEDGGDDEEYSDTCLGGICTSQKGWETGRILFI
jgi:hypothetical protein